MCAFYASGFWRDRTTPLLPIVATEFSNSQLLLLTNDEVDIYE
jgi:hypothetical protein